MTKLERLSYIVLFSLITTSGFFAQTIRFNTLTIKDGLSQSVINCVGQDPLGYMWIGTQDGLNRYDGINFRIHKHIVNNTNSLTSSFILTFVSDTLSGKMYLGTQNGGVNVYDPVHKKFESPKTLGKISTSTINDLILINQKLYIATSKEGLWVWDVKTGQTKVFDKTNDFPGSKISKLSRIDNTLWVGTDGQGAILFDLDTEKYTHFQSVNNKSSLLNNNVSAAVQYSPNVVLLGTQSGLNLIDLSLPIPKFSVLKPNKKDFTLNSVEDILKQNDTTFWVATSGNGVFKINIEGGKPKFTNYLSSDLNNYSIPHNIVNDIFQDRTGSIWIGTQDGLAYFDPVKQGFNSYAYEFGSKKSLLDKTVWSIHPTDTIIYVGTRQGITAINRITNQYFQYPFKSSNLNQPNNNSIYFINIDRFGKIWTATSSGVFLLNVNAADPSKFNYHKVNFRAEPDEWDDDHCYYIKFDDKDYAWVGCKEGLARIHIIDLAAEHFVHDPNNSSSVTGNDIRVVFIDSQGNHWTGSAGGGLSKFNPIAIDGKTTLKFEHYLNNPNNLNSLSNNTVLSIHEEPEGTLWIATYGGGLNKFDIDTEQFDVFTEEDGLANNATYGITGSSLKNTIWISTNFGLSSYNYKTKTFENYTENDGLLSNEFNTGAYFEAENGELFFGGINGFNSFFPEDIKPNTVAPEVVITDILIYNRPIEQEVEGIGAISFLDELELGYEQNNLTFKFAALHYTFPKGNKYKVLMEGVDNEEILINDLQQINYSNLSPGVYTFKVWASNSDGIWSKEPKTLIIRISAPYWSTWWFITVCVGVLALIIYLFYLWRIRSMKSQKERLAFLVEKRTKTITQQKEQLENHQKELEVQKEKSDNLLLNILPAETVEELKNKGKTKPRYYRMVTVLFTDIKGFTKIAEAFKPTELVKRLDNLFREIDKIIEKHQIEKIKTIGDAYMAAGGVPLRDKENPIHCVLAALEIQRFMEKEAKRYKDEEPWQLRIGLHTGDVIAGVIGTKRIAYDIWGNTVNVANRMEMASEPGKVNISGRTFEYIKPYFDCTYRGKVPAKNKGEIDMYYVEGIKPHLSKGGRGTVPNKKFTDYVHLHIYSSINYRKAERHIMKILKAELSPNLHYHGIHHTYDVVDAVERLAIMEGVLDEDIFVLKSAATYHDAGFVEQYDKNEPIGARMASEILPLYGYTEEQVSLVHRLIYATIVPHNPQTKLEEIICDADLDYLGRDDFHQIADTLRRELRDHGKINSDRMWDEIQIKFLEQHRYFTKSAIKLRQEKKLKHIEEIKQRLKENNYKD
ncbi:adenylate/guanylate cyclase domain-containing protein [Parvicella tangerina]|nr:adenylate/guanylate cyclase domain-containing protein [Parvicella tangerina]